jgi:hypothetical protein
MQRVGPLKQMARDWVGCSEYIKSFPEIQGVSCKANPLESTEPDSQNTHGRNRREDPHSSHVVSHIGYLEDIWLTYDATIVPL